MTLTKFVELWASKGLLYSDTQYIAMLLSNMPGNIPKTRLMSL